MPRIVLVSNRVTDLTTAAQAGGLSVAIADIMLNRAALWFGWNGEVTDVDDVPAVIRKEEIHNSILASMPLSESEFRDYYLGYSNSVLWPVFHNRLDLAQFEAGFFPEYLRVNRRFAAELIRLVEHDDVIWIHDYHLIPLAAELRALGAKNPIGFFLHVPVPPCQSYLAIPEHLEISTALAAYDLVGVQTQQDVANLIDIFQNSVSGQLLPDGRIRVGAQLVQITSIPVGIDIDEFVGDAAESVPMADGPDFRIIGIDRLDYTKGLPHKFKAYGRFLEENPQYRRRVVLSQIAPPTRDTLEAYSDIRGELKSLSGSINGRYSELDWMPIYYMHRSVSRNQLFGIYRGSKVGLVTPLRDGMNLVAKEYVAAQDPADPGVLVLSRFAGAAEQLKHAVIINPYNIAEMADAIKFAIEMPLSERKRRHQALLAVVAANDSAHWTRVFLSELIRVSASTRTLSDGDGDSSKDLDAARHVRNDAKV